MKNIIFKTSGGKIVSIDIDKCAGIVRSGQILNFVQSGSVDINVTFSSEQQAIDFMNNLNKISRDIVHSTNYAKEFEVSNIEIVL